MSKVAEVKLVNLYTFDIAPDPIDIFIILKFPEPITPYPFDPSTLTAVIDPELVPYSLAHEKAPELVTYVIMGMVPDLVIMSPVEELEPPIRALPEESMSIALKLVAPFRPPKTPGNLVEELVHNKELAKLKFKSILYKDK